MLVKLANVRRSVTTSVVPLQSHVSIPSSEAEMELKNYAAIKQAGAGSVAIYGRVQLNRSDVFSGTV